MKKTISLLAVIALLVSIAFNALAMKDSLMGAFRMAASGPTPVHMKNVGDPAIVKTNYNYTRKSWSTLNITWIHPEWRTDRDECERNGGGYVDIYIEAEVDQLCDPGTDIHYLGYKLSLAGQTIDSGAVKIQCKEGEMVSGSFQLSPRLNIYEEYQFEFVDYVP